MATREEWVSPGPDHTNCVSACCEEFDLWAMRLQ